MGEISEIFGTNIRAEYRILLSTSTKNSKQKHIMTLLEDLILQIIAVLRMVEFVRVCL